MLVITRKIGESVIIDGDIEVKVLKYSRGQVQLGFNAPDEVKFVREELIEDDLPVPRPHDPNTTIP